jgi:putative membrane protein
MKIIFKILTMCSLVTLLACNEAKRGNDSDAAYDADDSKEQAEELNDEKFEDDKMENDAEFVANTVASNYGEIQAAEMAKTKASDPEVKKIAGMLVMDHNKTLGELKTLASAKSISIPSEADNSAMNKAENLANESGKEFDKKWCEEMIDRHESTIKKFERHAEKTEDAELKAWIDKTLPALKNHHQQLEACHERLEKSNS